MVERLKEEHNVDVEWQPFYLYFDTPSEGKELPDYVKRGRANGSEERLRSIANLYNMEFKSTERIYNTRLAHEATEYAREYGKGTEFHRIVFRLVYAEGKDISRWDVLRSAAQEAGLDDEAMQRDVEGGKYTESVNQQVQWAYQIGVTGVPTYVINDRYAVVGAQPYEAFKNALNQIMNQKRPAE
ncbi:MAG TPA: thioredoxin [Anaerolineae bacterium]|nr:thioredoxin [Anaerolineae bacterium]